MTSYYRWWERSDKLWLVFYNLHVIPNVHTKFDNNPFDSFGDYRMNIYRHRRGQSGRQRADRHLETRDLYFCILVVMKRRGSIKEASRPMDSLTIHF